MDIFYDMIQNFKLSRKQRNLLLSKAQKEGMSVSSYIRWKCGLEMKRRGTRWGLKKKSL